MNYLPNDITTSAPAMPSNRYVLPSFEERTPYGYKRQDPYAKLFEDRIIFLGTQVDDASADDIMAQLLVLEPQEQEEIHLSSAHDLAYRMPLSLLVGSGMLIAVTLADIVNSVILALSRPALRAKLLEEGSGNDIELLDLFDQVDSNVLLTITGTVLVGFVAIYSAVHLFLLWSTLRGSSKARRLALLLTALNFAAITGGVLWGHQSLPLSTIFFQLALPCLRCWRSPRTRRFSTRRPAPSICAIRRLCSGQRTRRFWSTGHSARRRKHSKRRRHARLLLQAVATKRSLLALSAT